MVITVNIKSDQPAVSFRHVGHAMGLHSNDIKERVIKMKTKHEDYKWNGILIFGKRYGRYNIAVAYLAIDIIILLLFIVSRFFLTEPLGEIFRSVLRGVFLGSSIAAYKATIYTNVLLIASPKLCILFLHAMRSNLLLIESNNSYLKFQRTVTGDSCIYVYDIKRNIIWID